MQWSRTLTFRMPHLYFNAIIGYMENFLKTENRLVLVAQPWCSMPMAVHCTLLKELLSYIDKRSPSDHTPVYHHVGVYAYCPATLKAYASCPVSELEALEVP